eukprot:jgi/Galph1/4706/GphlegSOOS_G3378.1
MSSFVLSLFTTLSRWNTASIPEKEKLIDLQKKIWSQDTSSLSFDEFSLALKLFSRFLQDTLPPDSKDSRTEDSKILASDPHDNLLSKLMELLTVLLSREEACKYLLGLKSTDESFPVVAHIIWSFLIIATSRRIESSMCASGFMVLSRNLIPNLSLSVAMCSIPGIVSKVCKLLSGSFHERQAVVLAALDCLGKIISKSFPCNTENNIISEQTVRQDCLERLASVFKQQADATKRDLLYKDTNDSVTETQEEAIRNTISCLEFMLLNKDGPVYHPHLAVRKQTAQVIEIILNSQLGKIKNLNVIFRSLYQFCGDSDEVTRLEAQRVLFAYQKSVENSITPYDLNYEKDVEITSIVDKVVTCKDLNQVDDSDLFVLFSISEFLMDSWRTPTNTVRTEDFCDCFIRIGRKLIIDLLKRFTSEDSSRLFSFLKSLHEESFVSDVFALRRFVSCVTCMGARGALDWFFSVALNSIEQNGDEVQKVVVGFILSRMIIGALGSHHFDISSAVDYFIPDLMDYYMNLMHGFSLEESDGSYISVHIKVERTSLILVGLYSLEEVFIRKAQNFYPKVLESLAFFVSLVGHQERVIISETKRILLNIFQVFGYKSIIEILREHLNYLIDVICESFLRYGYFYPALKVLLNTDTELTKDCIFLASSELNSLLDAIPYWNIDQIIRLMRLIGYTMRQCAPDERVPLSQSFPYTRPIREPGLFSEPFLLKQKLGDLLPQSSLDEETCNLDTSNESNSSSMSNVLFMSQEQHDEESPMVVHDSVVLQVAEKTVFTCLELLPESDGRIKVLALQTVTSCLDVLAQDSKKLLPMIPQVLSALNKEFALWKTQSTSKSNKLEPTNETAIYILTKSSEESAVSKNEKVQLPSISLLDAFCEVIISVIRYTGDFSRTTISGLMLPKLVEILKLIVSHASSGFWESTVYNGYALSSFRCLDMVTSQEGSMVVGYIEELVDIVVPLIRHEDIQNASVTEKQLQRHTERMCLLRKFASQILYNLVLADPSKTWYCLHRKLIN